MTGAHLPSRACIPRSGDRWGMHESALHNVHALLARRIVENRTLKSNFQPLMSTGEAPASRGISNV